MPGAAPARTRRPSPRLSAPVPQQRRPVREPDRAAGAAPRWQRHRRRRGDGRRARGHRALQRRIGGGGYFVHYDAAPARSAPSTVARPRRRMRRDAFIDPATGEPVPVHPGPGHQRGLGRHARHPRHLAACAAPVGDVGRLRAGAAPVGPARPCAGSRSTTRSGSRPRTTASGSAPSPPRAGSSCPSGPRGRLDVPQPRPGRHPRPDRPARAAARVLHRPAAGEIVRRSRTRPTSRAPTSRCRRASMTRRDLDRYRVVAQRPTSSDYRWFQVYGMAPSSSGGTTVGEALDIMEQYDLAAMDDAAPCTTTSRPVRSPSPTGPRTSATRPSSTSRSRTCSVDEFAAERACGSTRSSGRASRSAPATSRATTASAPTPRRRPAPGRTRERRDHEPHGGRPVGRHRRVHPHHRADRRLRHRRPRPRLPAQQRAHRLLPGVRPPTTPTGSSR